MKKKNPYNICTLDDQYDCTSCGIQGKLACKWDKKILSGFHAIGFPPVVIAIFGMVLVGILTGIWWFLIAYLIYCPVMFVVSEGRFLCSHCPYWAEDSKTLHCLGNHGNPKLWRYHPEPMNKFEQFMMYFLIATIFFVFPLAALGYGIWFLSYHYAGYGLISLLGLIGITVASLLTSFTLVAVLKIFFCSKCINFSCPLNTVSKPVIDEYLDKNPVMKEAWEKKGYKLG